MACEQKVRVWYNEKGVPFRYKLYCSGDCKAGDGKPCTPKSEPAGKDLTKEFCACDGGDGGQAKGCQIVLYTKKVGKQTEHYFKCEGNLCGAGTTCAPVRMVNDVEVAIPDDDGKYSGKLGKWIEFKCDCVPDDEVWPK